MSVFFRPVPGNLYSLPVRFQMFFWTPALMCLFWSQGLLAEGVKEVQRPNIVFLLADDQSTYSMGCYGTPGVQTPHMDQLAHDGIVFDKHYDTTAICMASRANIMTGKYEFKTGCNFEHGPLLLDQWQNSYPLLLREAGYQTAFAGKFGFEVAEQAGEKGILPSEDFDRWGGGPGQTSYSTKRNKSMEKYSNEYPHSTLSYGAFGRDFILEASQVDRPFCLSISFKAPHHPTTPDPRFDHVYEGATFVKPSNYGRQYGDHFAKQSRFGRQYERFHSWHYSDDYDQVMATYYQQIYAIDVAVGMVRQALREAGADKNTVVIYTSDNGFMCGSHGYGSKVLPYEEASRVPLIIYDPRVDLPALKSSPANVADFLKSENGPSGSVSRSQGPASVEVGSAVDAEKDASSIDGNDSESVYRRCDALTGNVDIGPTILGLAGLPLPLGVDGKDLMTLYTGSEESLHEWLPLINVWGPSKVHSLSVVTKDWKLIRWPSAGSDLPASEELYHLASDPLEITNLVDVDEIASDRQVMRGIYDRAVDQWEREAVLRHGYPELVSRFQRK